MRSVLLGIISIALIATGSWLAFVVGGNEYQFTAAACMRSGLVLFAFWLALPQLQKFEDNTPAWAFLAFIAVGAVAVFRPRLLFILIPLLAGLGALKFVGWLFAPLPKRKASQNNRREPPPQQK